VRRSLLLIVLLLASPALAEDPVLPTTLDRSTDQQSHGRSWQESVTGTVERLEYDIRWGLLSLGRASIENRALSSGGTNRIVRTMEVRNHPWAAVIYRIEDRIESVDERTDGGRKVCVRKQIHEGRFNQDDTLLIDYRSGKAQWEDRLSDKSANYEIPDGVLDYVSLVSHLRTQGDLTLGQTNWYHLAMDAGTHELVVSAVTTGLVKTAFGRLAATQIRVKSKSEDLFARNVPGTMWVCQNPMVVVAMDGSTKVGTVRAVLRGWERNGRAVIVGEAPDEGGTQDEDEIAGGGSIGVVGHIGAWGSLAGRPHSGRRSDEP
jgi:hypothetical protein